MKKKKNRFWLFLFSLWPGAGHMYMGFMKMGLSLTLGFMLMIGVVGITNIGVLAVFPITLYIYSFFHANNIGGLDDEQFAMIEDEYLLGFGRMDFDYKRFRLERKERNIMAVVLIILGVCMLWNVGFSMVIDYVGFDNPLVRSVYYMVRDDLPRVVIAIAIIWFGIVLLRGKKNIYEISQSEESRQIGVQAEQAGQTGQMNQADQGQTEQMNRTEQSNQADQMNQTAQDGEKEE